MAEDYRASLPPKLNQDRGNAGGAGYQRADVRRAGNAPSIKTGLVDQHGKSVDGMSLQPDPHDSPSMPPDQNGFAPLNGDLPPADDAQSQQVDQPELDIDIAAPPVPENTERPTDGGISDPTPGDSDPGSSGGAEAPGYQGLTDASHPRGYPSN